MAALRDEPSCTAVARSGRDPGIEMTPLEVQDGTIELFASDGHPTSARLSTAPRTPDDDGVYLFVELGAILHAYRGLALTTFCAGALARAGLTSAVEGFITGTTTVADAAVGPVGAVLAIAAGPVGLGANVRAQHGLLDATPAAEASGTSSTGTSAASKDDDTGRIDR